MTRHEPRETSATHGFVSFRPATAKDPVALKHFIFSRRVHAAGVKKETKDRDF